MIKAMKILCDILFLVICDKLIMLVCCSSDGKWRVDMDVTCWQGEHKYIASMALIALSYYIPFSIMIAPMFAEFSPPLKGNCRDYLSLTSTVELIKPYLSAVTLAKSCLLVGAQLISQGEPLGVLLTQLIMCLILFFSTAIWSWYSLSSSHFQNAISPAFPYSISILKSITFAAGIVGSVIELLFVHQLLPYSIFGIHLSKESADLEFLMIFLAIACILALIFYFSLKWIVKIDLQHGSSDGQPLLQGIEMQDSAAFAQVSQLVAFDPVSNHWFWT
ncbi:hypothetical protein RFI_27195 [Reticulomyxa filosa]|uniref:Uncharacterized protein n=1 Tax=Reticulomyxa filosa TaxID=46433 RepID=X6M947_RETFI|nr:hypothetical protein RFI_27195 [Reticulomyxa filosa]|eukprot:ETO10181.1 hypothetical protein RFI_27195 [Reticulomyxa filosa]